MSNETRYAPNPDAKAEAWTVEEVDMIGRWHEIGRHPDLYAAQLQTRQIHDDKERRIVRHRMDYWEGENAGYIDYVRATDAGADAIEFDDGGNRFGSMAYDAWKEAK